MWKESSYEPLPNGASIVLRNFGNGPADIIKILAGIEFHNKGAAGPSAVMPDHVAEAQPPVVSTQDTTKFFIPAGLTHNSPEFSDLFEGKKQYAVFGWIKYRGLPDTEYETHFCWIYDPAFRDFPNPLPPYAALNTKLNRRT